MPGVTDTGSFEAHITVPYGRESSEGTYLESA